MFSFSAKFSAIKSTASVENVIWMVMNKSLPVDQAECRFNCLLHAPTLDLTLKSELFSFFLCGIFFSSFTISGSFEFLLNSFFLLRNIFYVFFRCDSRSIPINTFRIFKLFFYSSFSCHTISLSRLRREMSSSRMVISFLQRRSFIEAKSYKTSFLCSTYEAPSDDG